MATKRLAAWAVDLKYDNLPSSVQHAALRSLYNYVGCAIHGADHPTVHRAWDAHVFTIGSSPKRGSMLLGQVHRETSLKPDIFTAALLNGIASHVHDFDDTHLATIIHPTGPVASAALAFAQRSATVSGRDVLLAITAGIEASCKLGLAVWPEHYDIGWHITSTTGSIGAAVAVGKLLKLEPQQMAHAIGLASVHNIGLREMFGSDTKSYHVGAAAMAGLRAAVMAEKDFTSSETALEAKRGWANVVAGGGTPKLDQYLSELGQRWEIERNAFKPYPCGIVCHPVIDACIQLHDEVRDSGLDAADIESVRAKVHPLVIELTSKRSPRDGLEGKFSVFYGAAVGLWLGKAGPDQYSEQVITDPHIISLRNTVEVDIDEKLRSDESHVEIVFKGGRRLVKHVDHAIGSLESPMTDDQLESKFIGQVSRSIGLEDAQKISRACWDIAKYQSIQSWPDLDRCTENIEANTQC